MKLHRFLVETPGTFTPEQEHQLRHVLRVRSGDRVLVFDGRAPVDTLLEATADGWRAVGTCAHAPEPRTRLIAYPALLQRDKYETVLQKLTELGVAEVVPLLSERALVRAAPDARRVQRWRSILREATEQCGRGRVPVLRGAQSFEHAVAKPKVPCHRLRRLSRARPSCSSRGSAGDGVALRRPRRRLRPTTRSPWPPARRVVTLGPRILRAETAAPVLAALVLTSWAIYRPLTYDRARPRLHLLPHRRP